MKKMNEDTHIIKSEERDFEAIRSKDLKFSNQCLLPKTKTKANIILCIINKRISYKLAKVISKLYRSYVMPHLEYCIQFWSSTNLKAADMLEGVKKRTTKMNSEFKKIII